MRPAIDMCDMLLSNLHAGPGSDLSHYLHLQHIKPPRPRMQTQSAASCSRRPWRRSTGSLCIVSAIVSDHSARVRGPIRHVYNWVGDYANLQAWYPGINSLRVTRGQNKPLDIRHQFEVQQTISGFKLTTLYEVVELVPDKKVVYSVGSDLHHSTEQLIFMPDPNDPSYTMVRHMSQTELTEWRKALTPVVSGVLRKMPEQGLQQLSALLMSSNSPIRQEPGRSPRHSAGSSWSFNNIFSSLGGSDKPSGSKKVSSPRVEPQVDVLGYYAALGLDGRRGRKMSGDDIKSAFRRAAQTMHPDKFSLADEEDRLEAEEAFKKVQKAYEVLRDPEQRKLYDQGKLMQLEESLM